MPDQRTAILISRTVPMKSLKWAEWAKRIWRTRKKAVDVVNGDDATLLVSWHPDRHIETSRAIADDACEKESRAREVLAWLITALWSCS